MTSPIIIFGANGGVGEETARRLDAEGYSLHLVGRSNATTHLAQELGASLTLGDVTDESLFSRVASDVGDAAGGLVYGVGNLNLKTLPRLSAKELLYDFQIHALGAALAVQALLPAMKRNEGGASVVLYSSIAATTGFAAHTSIGLAKGAINGLTVSLAAECAPHIRVNAIAPSLTDTPLAAGLLANEKLASSIADHHPLKRLGTTADIAALTIFLLSPAATWCTGQIIGLDGGRSTLAM